MRFPNKIINIKRQTFFSMILILDSFDSEIKVIELYSFMKEKMKISDFIEGLNLLYILEKIEISGDEIKKC